MGHERRPRGSVVETDSGQPAGAEYEIDGDQFSSWEELVDLLDPIFVQARLVPAGFRTGSLGGLDEVLGGWFNEQGTDDDFWPAGQPQSFVIRWKNSATSRERLGTPLQSIGDKRRELLKFSWHPVWITFSHKRESKEQLRKEIRQMKRGDKVDPTLFEAVVDIFTATPLGARAWRTMYAGSPSCSNDRANPGMSTWRDTVTG